jgi:GH18 family chitinase
LLSLVNEPTKKNLNLGWNHGSMLFSNMARDDAKRANFVKTSVDFLLKHKFDGLGEGFIYLRIKN